MKKIGKNSVVFITLCAVFNGTHSFVGFQEQIVPGQTLNIQNNTQHPITMELISTRQPHLGVLGYKILSKQRLIIDLTTLDSAKPSARNNLSNRIRERPDMLRVHIPENLPLHASLDPSTAHHYFTLLEFKDKKGRSTYEIKQAPLPEMDNSFAPNISTRSGNVL